MRFLILPFLFGLLIGVPGARAECLKDDCSDDPKAWADMFGTTLEQQAEQSRARVAAEAWVISERNANNEALLRDLGQQDRIRLTYSLEDTLTRLASKPATVLRATVAARGGAYVFCGSAMYADRSQGAFVLDTRPGGVAKLKATREDFATAACQSGATILR